jgi:UDP-N-acetylglucosamine transferase subunit ALG13
MQVAVELAQVHHIVLVVDTALVLDAALVVDTAHAVDTFLVAAAPLMNLFNIVN